MLGREATGMTAGFVGLIVGGVGGLLVGLATLGAGDDLGFAVAGLVGACLGFLVPFAIAAAWPLREEDG
jgi:hypothetical protein